MTVCEHWYRVIKSSWGIAIRIRGSFAFASEYSEDAFVQVAKGLKLLIKTDYILEEEKEFIYKGLRRVSREILSVINSNEELCIVLEEFIFSDCDFQPEGLEAAIIEWTSKAFGFKAPNIEVTFDRAANHYYFNYD